jgi:hypothetical protein
MKTATTTTALPPPKRLRTEENDDGVATRIPTFDLASLMKEESNHDDLLATYRVFQAIHFKATTTGTKIDKDDSDSMTKEGVPAPPQLVSWKDICSIFHSLNSKDQESWCIENPGDSSERRKEEEDVLKPSTFLAPRNKVSNNNRAYCSFLVQKDQQSYQQLLKRLPLATFASSSPALLPLNDSTWTYEPCLWIFFGRNHPQQKDDTAMTTTDTDDSCTNQQPLEGRGLHTDSVSHDGTWHYQLSGDKTWYLSPSCDLLRHWQQQQQQQKLSTTGIPSIQWDESTQLQVACQQGDVLMLNTRLWFHRTVIPCQVNPSVSYARDFRIDKQACSTDNNTNKNNSTMTNLDGLYARTDIEAGTILFTEHDMPDCELHRTSIENNANCHIQQLDDGISAVVSRRNIACGEFFCIPESSSEEEDDDDEEEDEEGEGEEEQGEEEEDEGDEEEGEQEDSLGEEEQGEEATN